MNNVSEDIVSCIDFKIVNIGLAGPLLAEATGENGLTLNNLLLVTKRVNDISRCMICAPFLQVAPLHHHQHDRLVLGLSVVLLHVLAQTDLKSKLLPTELASLSFRSGVHRLSVFLKSVRLLEDLIAMCALELAMLLMSHVFHL